MATDLLTGFTLLGSAAALGATIEWVWLTMHRSDE